MTAPVKANFPPPPSCSQSPSLPGTSATSTLQLLQKAHPEVPAPSRPTPEALTLAHPPTQVPRPDCRGVQRHVKSWIPKVES